MKRTGLPVAAIAGAGIVLVCAAVAGILIFARVFPGMRSAVQRPEHPGGSANRAESSQPGADGAAPATGVDQPATGQRDATLVAPEVRAYLGALKELHSVVRNVVKTLQSIADRSSAQTAAPGLVALKPQLQTAMNRATLCLLAVDASPIAKRQLTRMTIQMNDADAEFARRALADAGLDQRPEENLDLTEALIRVARNPQAAPAHGAAQELRDVILSGRAPLAIPAVRRRLEQELGSLGAPLAHP